MITRNLPELDVRDLGVSLRRAATTLSCRSVTEDAHDPTVQQQWFAELVQQVDATSELFDRITNTIRQVGAVVVHHVPTKSDALLVAIVASLGHAFRYDPRTRSSTTWYPT